MSAKRLYSLSDENKDLQKQIGCMNRFLQLFDFQHFFLTRRLKDDTIKRLPSGQTGNRGTDSYNAFRTTFESSHETVREKQRTSTESSRTSISSSSWSSSFSWLECNKTNHLEQSLDSPANIPETPSRNMPVNQTNLTHSSRHSTDLQDDVDENVHKGSQGLSVKTATKEKVVKHKLKYVDSPRPVKLPNSPNPKNSSLGGSPRTPRKLGEAPSRYIENRSGSLPLIHARRVSYDGRELRDSSKSSMKLKEYPRLSLDSRQESIKGTHSTSNSTSDLHRCRGIQTHNHGYQKEPEIPHRPSSVVAKLMGLEAFPTTAPSTEPQIEAGTSYPLLEPSKSVNEKGQNKTPKTSFRNSESVVKYHRTSKIPIEPAPWRQQSEVKAPCTPSLKSQESPKNSNSFPSVYGEIEKRLAEIKFQNSGRDLRALKQILEAMQKTKERLESNTESYIPDPLSQTCNKRSVDQRFDLASLRSMPRDNRTSTMVKGIYSPNNFKSRILIMRPSEHVEKNCSATLGSAKDSQSPLKKTWACDLVNSRREGVGKQTKGMNPRKTHVMYSLACTPLCKDRNAKAFTQPKVPQQTEEDSFKSTSRVSPRSRQKKLALEKHSHSTIASTDSNTPRRIRVSRKQSTEPGSPRRELKPRILSPQHNDVHSKISNMKDKKDQGSKSSQQCPKTSMPASHIEAKATSTEEFDKVTYSFFKPAAEMQTNLVYTSSEEKPVEGLIPVPVEQPSPVSVIEAAFYREEPPSPIKKILSTFRSDQPMDTDEADEYTNDLNQLSNSNKPIHAPEISHNNVPNLQILVQNTDQTNSTHEMPILLFEETNPDHSYILEILWTSGLLEGANSDVPAVQCHRSGYLLDSKLFFQLEKTKASIWSSDVGEEYNCLSHDEKIQRRLIFDAVNEILLRKLVVERFLETSRGSTNKLATRKLTKEKLFRDVCNEIDHLQTNNANSIDDEEDYPEGIILQDLKNESESWTDCQKEFSGLILDVERLIFKDLIKEVVSDNTGGQNIRAGKHSRQLFH